MKDVAGIVEIHITEEQHEQAKNRREEIWNLTEDERENIFSQAFIIRDIRADYDRNAAFASALYGYETFKSYLGAPRENGGLDKKYTTVMRNIRIFEKYAVECGLKWNDSRIIGIDYTKLDIMIPVVTKENYGEWLAQARALSRSDLIDLVREKLEELAEDEEGDGGEGGGDGDDELTLEEKIKKFDSSYVREFALKIVERLKAYQKVSAYKDAATAMLGYAEEISSPQED